MFLRKVIRASEVIIEKCNHRGVVLCLAKMTDKNLAKKLGITSEQVEALANCERVELTAPVPVVPVRLRPINSNKVENFNTFEEANIAANGKDYVIEWDGLDSICCVDIDFAKPPTFNKLYTFACKLFCKPTYIFESRSGSAHLVYLSSGLLTAVELASVAALDIAIEYPLAKIELLCHTRNAKGELHTLTQANSVDGLHNRFIEATNCADSLPGYEVGKRYEHTQCPFLPVRAAVGNNPVVCMPNGIKCYYCNRFATFDVLAKTPQQPTELLVCARNFVHFEQVDSEIESFNLPVVARRGLYSALLKSLHGEDDPRISMVWHPAGLKKIYRKVGYWSDENNDMIDSEKNGIVEQLPFCYALSPTGTLVIDKKRLAWAKQNCDISVYGYKPFRTVAGYRFSQLDCQQSRILQIYPRYLRERSALQPRYIAEKQRVAEKDCENVIRRLFPGINVNLLKLLLIGRGVSEYDSGQLPCLAIRGPTESGKSLHCSIAAAITGDSPSRYSDQNDAQRFYEAVFANSRTSNYFLADELFKNYIDGKNNIITALLQLTPETTFHELYIGQTRLNCSPFVVITETTIPISILQNEQLCRRFAYVELQKKWEISKHLEANGIIEIFKMREYIQTCDLLAIDSLLSWLTDRYFMLGKPNFLEVAKTLGFKSLRDTDTLADRDRLICEFVDVLRKTKEDETTTRRFGRGYKSAKIQSNDPLWVLFAMLQTESDRRKGDTECNSLDESSICRITIKKHGRIIAFKLEK